MSTFDHHVIVGVAKHLWILSSCRRISISPQLSLLPKVLLHVGTSFVYAFINVHGFLAYCSTNCVAAFNAGQ